VPERDDLKEAISRTVVNKVPCANKIEPANVRVSRVLDLASDAWLVDKRSERRLQIGPDRTWGRGTMLFPTIEPRYVSAAGRAV
jgi:hypothetical protein